MSPAAKQSCLGSSHLAASNAIDDERTIISGLTSTDNGAPTEPSNGSSELAHNAEKGGPTADVDGTRSPADDDDGESALAANPRDVLGKLHEKMTKAAHKKCAQESSQGYRIQLAIAKREAIRMRLRVRATELNEAAVANTLPPACEEFLKYVTDKLPTGQKDWSRVLHEGLDDVDMYTEDGYYLLCQIKSKEIDAPSLTPKDPNFGKSMLGNLEIAVQHQSEFFQDRIRFAYCARHGDSPTPSAQGWVEYGNRDLASRGPPGEDLIRDLRAKVKQIIDSKWQKNKQLTDFVNNDGLFRKFIESYTFEAVPSFEEILEQNENHLKALLRSQSSELVENREDADEKRAVMFVLASFFVKYQLLNSPAPAISSMLEKMKQRAITVDQVKELIDSCCRDLACLTAVSHAPSSDALEKYRKLKAIAIEQDIQSARTYLALVDAAQDGIAAVKASDCTDGQKALKISGWVSALSLKAGLLPSARRDKAKRQKYNRKIRREKDLAELAELKRLQHPAPTTSGSQRSAAPADSAPTTLNVGPDDSNPGAETLPTSAVYADSSENGKWLGLPRHTTSGLPQQIVEPSSSMAIATGPNEKARASSHKAKPNVEAASIKLAKETGSGSRPVDTSASGVVGSAKAESSSDSEIDQDRLKTFVTRLTALIGHQATDNQNLLRALHKLVDNNGETIRSASSHGHTAVVELLLRDKRADPSILGNKAVRSASEYGHAAVVDLLLHDERVDPSALDNKAIQLASEKGHAAVVDLLLHDKRVDPSAGNNHGIQMASRNGHTATVELLLRDKRADPAAHNSEAIRSASSHGHTAIVELLLRDKRADPSALDNTAIQCASTNGHAAVVDLLLQDERVDPSTADNKAIRIASRLGYDKVVGLLLCDKRVDPSAREPMMDYRRFHHEIYSKRNSLNLED
ncbi:hypothetical protein HDU87_004378 [Geranomyces variabilis]|uniref:Ankyrin repeat protein n=1 Tax=Geranomyces variabilis TaxID=109894 RepID=A0AAD5XM09_9FUNG|nr:hypothetical protein HDU87_004378 [Geranomyces variabilis]